MPIRSQRTARVALAVIVMLVLFSISIPLLTLPFLMPSQLDDDSDRTAPKPATGFRRARGPLLEHAIEHDTEGDRYRLVHVGETTTVLLTGSLTECEARLAEELSRLHGTGHPNVPFPTFGGKQFWADLLVYAGWRIQENVYTGHCRLLDSDDVRRAWGSWESCRTALELERQKRGLRPRSDHLVVFLHGLIRSKDSFGELPEAIGEAGYSVANVNYPSTRRTIEEHAIQLEKILENAEDVRRVSFVTHSLGGIVVRKLLARNGAWKGRLAVGRVVMIAPPSRGSVAAETLSSWLPYQVVMGESGQELTPEKIAGLPAPTCEFGIIAGGHGDDDGYNPLLPGDDDGVVTVSNARLPGARDFLLVDATHTFIMTSAETRRAVLSFLARGRFDESRPAQPIPDEPDSAATLPGVK